MTLALRFKAMPVIPLKMMHKERQVLSLGNQGFDAVFPNHRV
jgi:hypothetical protein